jgi:hypothetical protein
MPTSLPTNQRRTPRTPSISKPGHARKEKEKGKKTLHPTI